MNLFLNKKNVDELVRIQREVALVKHVISSCLVVIATIFVIQTPCLVSINVLSAGSNSFENIISDKKSLNDIVDDFSIQKPCEKSVLNIIETTGADA